MPYAAWPVRRVPSIRRSRARSVLSALARSDSPVDSLAKPWKRTLGRFMSRRSISASICCGMPRSIAIENVCGV